MKDYLLALDQGTTSSRAILFTSAGEVVATGQIPFLQHYPQPGWVEHDPLELLDSQLQAAAQCVAASGVAPGDIAALGLANQRETALLWEKATGQPVGRAIVWQCRRTAAFCTQLQEEGYTEAIRARTGLLPDASQADIDKAEDYVRGLEGVASVTFTDKEQALENFRSSNTTDIIDALDGQNPLPASIDVELSDPQLVEQVASAIWDNPTYQQIRDGETKSESLKYGQQTVEKLFTLTNYVRYIGIALIALLIFIAMVFINNTIRLAILARRKEIAIMRLVGASNGFIRGPFLMEGALHAIIGSLLAVGTIELLRRFALPKIQSALMFLPLDLSTTAFLFIYAVLVVAGLVIGLLGSALAMRRYLKV